MWQPIRNAPFRRDIQLATINRDRLQVLQFACRRVDGGWLRSGSEQQIEMRPTHWRSWSVDQPADFVQPATAN